ncbi:MAG: transposase [Deltaproteobacteria bacterium]|nr:transposase [Deltaproteobacteria bacterium]MBW2122662.1 transposase [Deltaproteobacteria bacterium]
MSRPLRIEYRDAWYHVLNRGRRGEVAFAGEGDYARFIDLLKEARDMWNLRIAAYCLMPNHYHLLVQTPEANISRCMRHIDGVYTQRFNRVHDCDGQVFRGRYRSILIEADAYLLQLVRYIHRNPVRAGLTQDPDGYTWSSHKGYLSADDGWKWLYKEYVLSMLSTHKSERLRRYCEFMSVSDEKDERLDRLFKGKKVPSVLGSEGFVDSIRNRFFTEKLNEEIPESKRLAPEPDRIKEVVCEHYRIDRGVLFSTRRGVFNEPRSVAIYLCRRLRGDSLKEIGENFEVPKYTTVSGIFRRTKRRVAEDPRLRERVEGVLSSLRKTQNET